MHSKLKSFSWAAISSVCAFRANPIYENTDENAGSSITTT